MRVLKRCGGLKRVTKPALVALIIGLLLYVAARLIWALCNFWLLFWLLMIVALAQG